MALDRVRLEQGMLAQLNLLGFDTVNQFAFTNVLAKAFATAIVDEFTANAVVNGGNCTPGGAISGGTII